MLSNGRYRVVQHDKPEQLRFDPRIEQPEPGWLCAALYLTWTGIVACGTYVIVTLAETVAR